MTLCGAARHFVKLNLFIPTVLDIGAFERLLGPCKEVMKRNFQHYEEQLMDLFGTTLDISDAR